MSMQKYSIRMLKTAYMQPLTYLTSNKEFHSSNLTFHLFLIINHFPFGQPFFTQLFLHISLLKHFSTYFDSKGHIRPKPIMHDPKPITYGQSHFFLFFYKKKKKKEANSCPVAIIHGLKPLDISVPRKALGQRPQRSLIRHRSQNTIIISFYSLKSKRNFLI